MFERGKSDALFTDTLDLLNTLNTRDGRFEYADYVALHNNITALYDSFSEVDELIELAKAKAEGRLAILPLKVGSTIYRLEAPQYSREIVSATIYLDETIFTDDSDNIIKETDIGKTVFLTREAAEKAIGGETERGKEG